MKKPITPKVPSVPKAAAVPSVPAVPKVPGPAGQMPAPKVSRPVVKKKK